jgi:CBS domain-containing protein
METSAIRYRVVEFLRKYPPFHAMEDEDLLNLAQQGRVRFFEQNEYVLWQGASRFEILVIQQGTVSLWDETGAEPVLYDIRGTGDMLGIDDFERTRGHSHSAKSSGDSLVYAFPADQFLSLILKYPYARRFAAAHAGVASDYKSDEQRMPQDIFLHDVVARRKLASCDSGAGIRDVARQMLTTGADAIAVLDANHRAHGVLTVRSFLEWIVESDIAVKTPVEHLLHGAPGLIASDASVTDAVLAMSASDSEALAVTSTGSPDERVHAVVTVRDLSKVFGDQPASILSEIRRASETSVLRDLNNRVRAFVLNQLTSATSFDWLSRFVAQADASIFRRIVSMEQPGIPSDCWCFFGSAGREESLTGVAPRFILIASDDRDLDASQSLFLRVLARIDECGYLLPSALPFETSFFTAGLHEWKMRFEQWVHEPVLNEMYRARPLFDLRPIQGPRELWNEIESTATAAFDRDFLYVLANDCLTNLPPLTFFHEAVVEESGGETAVFRLEERALLPLIDVGRVFGMAAQTTFARSTFERFAAARMLLPESESIFRNASEALRVLLWQQGRVGLRQKSSGSELPPSLLSRYDRQILRNAFRSIHRLLEFTADLKWIEIL